MTAETLFTPAESFTDRVWSGLQHDVFTALVDGAGNLVVRARAGTGKTTTIVEAVKRWLRANPGKRATVCAFGKDIQLELVKRFIGFEVDVRTLHSIGLGIVKSAWPSVVPNYGVARERALATAVCGARVPEDIMKLVAKLCTKGRLCAPLATQVGELTELMDAFDCYPPEEWAEVGYDAGFVEAKALEAMELAASVKPREIDGADMLFLPVRNRWMRRTQDLVVVDECQDMNAAQLLIAQGICRGRLMVVGDDRQAIFGFAGADSGSLDRLKAAYGAAELTLNITYRCGQAIVREAQNFVPDFIAGPNNPEGQILSVDRDTMVTMAGPGDFVLSRTNAPLVSAAMKLLRAGKRTKVAGKDIGNGLISLVRKLKARSVPNFLTLVSGWQQREQERLLAQFKGKGDLSENAAYQARYEMINDQADMLVNISDGARNVDEITARIEALFAEDKELGEAGLIICSSVHKAKGREANRVFILADTLRPAGDVEEQNICYVAITRAKSTLVYVGKGGAQ